MKVMEQVAHLKLSLLEKKIGDKWSDSTIMGDIKTYNYYTLKSVNGNVATLELKGKQIINKKIEQQGMEINVKMEATISGEGIVDLNTGLLEQKTTLTVCFNAL